MKKIFFVGFLVALMTTLFAQSTQPKPEPYKPNIRYGTQPHERLPDMREHPLNDEIMRTAEIVLIISNSGKSVVSRNDEGKIFTSQILDVKQVLRGGKYLQEKTKVELIYYGGTLTEPSSPPEHYNENAELTGIEVLRIPDNYAHQYILFGKIEKNKTKFSIEDISTISLSFSSISTQTMSTISWTEQNNYFLSNGLYDIHYKSKQNLCEYLTFYGINCSSFFCHQKA